MKFNNRRACLYPSHQNIESKAKTLLQSAKYRAEIHNINFDLDLNWVINNLRILRCQFTTIKLTLNYNNDGKVMYNSASIHKLIPELGYIKSNCVIIANSVNMFISNHQINDVLFIAKLINDNNSRIFYNYKN